MDSSDKDVVNQSLVRLAGKVDQIGQHNLKKEKILEIHSLISPTDSSKAYTVVASEQANLVDKAIEEGKNPSFDDGTPNRYSGYLKSFIPSYSFNHTPPEKTMPPTILDNPASLNVFNIFQGPDGTLLGKIVMPIPVEPLERARWFDISSSVNPGEFIPFVSIWRDVDENILTALGHSNRSIVASKMINTSEMLWSKRIGVNETNYYDHGWHQIVSDPTGNIYVINTMHDDIAWFSKPAYTINVTKLSSDGVVIWSKSYQDQTEEGMASTPPRPGVLITGNYLFLSFSIRQCLGVLKVNLADGNFTSVKIIDTDSYSYPFIETSSSITLGVDGNIYITSGMATIGYGFTSFSKLDQNLNHQFTKYIKYSGPRSFGPERFIVANGEFLLIYSLSTDSYSDLIIYKFDSDGTLIEQKAYEGDFSYNLNDVRPYGDSIYLLMTRDIDATSFIVEFNDVAQTGITKLDNKIAQSLHMGNEISVGRRSIVNNGRTNAHITILTGYSDYESQLNTNDYWYLPSKVDFSIDIENRHSSSFVSELEIDSGELNNLNFQAVNGLLNFQDIEILVDPVLDIVPVTPIETSKWYRVNDYSPSSPTDWYIGGLAYTETTTSYSLMSETGSQRRAVLLEYDFDYNIVNNRVADIFDEGFPLGSSVGQIASNGYSHIAISFKDSYDRPYIVGFLKDGSRAVAFKKMWNIASFPNPKLTVMFDQVYTLIADSTAGPTGVILTKSSIDSGIVSFSKYLNIPNNAVSLTTQDGWAYISSTDLTGSYIVQHSTGNPPFNTVVWGRRYEGLYNPKVLGYNSFVNALFVIGEYDSGCALLEINNSNGTINSATYFDGMPVPTGATYHNDNAIIKLDSNILFCYSTESNSILWTNEIVPSNGWSFSTDYGSEITSHPDNNRLLVSVMISDDTGANLSTIMHIRTDGRWTGNYQNDKLIYQPTDFIWDSSTITITNSNYSPTSTDSPHSIVDAEVDFISGPYDVEYLYPIDPLDEV